MKRTWSWRLFGRTGLLQPTSISGDGLPKGVPLRVQSMLLWLHGEDPAIVRRALQCVLVRLTTGDVPIWEGPAWALPTGPGISSELLELTPPCLAPQPHRLTSEEGLKLEFLSANDEPLPEQVSVMYEIVVGEEGEAD